LVKVRGNVKIAETFTELYEGTTFTIVGDVCENSEKNSGSKNSTEMIVMRDDNLAIMFSSMKNAEAIGKQTCIVPRSKLIIKILELLKKENYIKSFEDAGKNLKVILAKRISDCGVIKPRFSVKKGEYEKWERRYLKTDRKELKSMIGTITAHIKNMIRGVCEGFEYILKIHYVHFPMSVEIKDNIVYIKNFLGERGPRTARIIGDTKVTVNKDEVIVSSIDREAAGKTAANIEQACRISRRDRRVFQDGIYIAKKPGRKFGDA